MNKYLVFAFLSGVPYRVCVHNVSERTDKCAFDQNKINSYDCAFVVLRFFLVERTQNLMCIYLEKIKSKF